VVTSALRSGRHIPPHEDTWYSFLLRDWVDPRAIVWLEGLGQLKIQLSHRESKRDLPACSIVPHPTTLPRAPNDDDDDDSSSNNIAGFEILTVVTMKSSAFWGCNAVLSGGSQLTFRRNMSLPSSSRSRSQLGSKPTRFCSLPVSCCCLTAQIWWWGQR
jgi:hypothetical protein